jgi:hypothetical protein
MRAFLMTPLKPGLDTSGLEHYGEMVVLHDTPPMLWDTVKLKEETLRSLERHEYDPARDYIVLTGAVIYVALYAMTVCEYVNLKFPEDSTLNVLVYDASKGLYRPIGWPRWKQL